jgi:cytochrome c peroxidase
MSKHYFQASLKLKKYYRQRRYTLLIGLSACLFLATSAHSNAQITTKEALGESLYFDTKLSFNRTQSCASCHNPATGFVDQRSYKKSFAHLEGAVSLGDDQHSFGDRSAPTSSYANQIPAFHINRKGAYVGGQFWDGRAATLIDQAKGPPLAAIEMGIPDKSMMQARLLESSHYKNAFIELYGLETINNAELLYDAMADSIAAYENTDFFSPFDSKYDRYLNGEYELSPQEELGMTLFFSQQFTNCNQCHQLNNSPTAANEPFSNYEYHNIGVPKNKAVRAQNKTDEKYVDIGLLAHPAVNDEKHRGKFKTPTLRNVAVTGPYMHNGIFKELKTVVDFYNKYNSKSTQRQINPETGERWAEPEVSNTLSSTELEFGPALNDTRINALVAFLKLLTDKRYEHLIE